MHTHHTKNVVPQTRRVVPRERLFQLLDALHDFPVTWISAPAGSGKTTLVASYLQARGVTPLWYRVDEADSDVASFFYYMAEGAAKLKKGRKEGRKDGLPHLSPEVNKGIAAFTRHFFEALYERMEAPAAIVIDNFQDAPDGSGFHDVLRTGLGLIPEGIRVFVVSRTEIPASFISLKADSTIAGIGWDDIRFSAPEVAEMIRLRKQEDVPEELSIQIHEETQGWAAAIVLIMDRLRMPPPRARAAGQGPVFDYFAFEVFERLSPETQDFLLKAAVFPSISPDIASRLTGVEQGPAILAELSRNHLFTDRYGAEYRFHPLFREFLLNRTNSMFKADEIASLTLVGAEHLAKSGRIEEAIRLLLDAGAFAEAAPLMTAHARELLAQGRTATLEGWAARIPEDLRDEAPWLAYWLGMGRLVTDPAGANRLFEKAFSAFEAAADETGCLLSAAGAIHSIMLEWDDYHSLDKWIEWIDAKVDRETPFPSPEIEANVASAMVCGLTYRKPGHRNMTMWIDRTMRAGERVSDPLTRFMTVGNVIEFHGQVGNYVEMYPLAEEMRRLASSSQAASPLVRLTYMVRLTLLHDWVSGSWEETFGLIRKAIRLAEDMGAYLHLGVIYVSASIAAFEMDDLGLAAEFLGKMEGTAFSGKRAVRLRYSLRKAFYLLKSDNLAEALHEAGRAIRAAQETGWYHAEVYGRILLAYVLRRMGEPDSAALELDRAEKLSEPLGVVHALYLIRLTEATLLFEQGDRERAAKALAEAFHVGRNKGYAMTLYFWWQPREMGRLCAEALALGIETEYALEMVRRHGLTPEGPQERLRNWPWPCRIRALGTFEVEMNGEPLRCSGKVQKRPLELLKTLVSLGGKDVREDAIQDALWPDAEGDTAHIAFKTNLSRLRKLLGNDRFIEVKEGRLSLNGRYVWLDTWALEGLAAQVSEMWEERRGRDGSAEAREAASNVCDVYRGDFLGGDGDLSTRSSRDRFRKRFQGITEKLIFLLSEAGDTERAATLREYAIDRGLPPRDMGRATITRLRT